MARRGPRLARSSIGLLVLSLLLALPAGPAAAAEWGGIEPGVTTLEEVRDRYGAPTRETAKKLDNYDTVEWLYEGAQAPNGMVRMTVEFGLLAAAGYRPRVVRMFRLDPRPFVFPKHTILEGWGIPDRAGSQDGRDVFLYDAGLIVTFDPQGFTATSMFFLLPQQAAPDAPVPGTSGPGGPGSAPGGKAPASGAPAPVPGAPGPSPTPPRP